MTFLSSKINRLIIILALLVLPFVFLLLLLTIVSDKPLVLLPSELFHDRGRWPYANPETTVHAFMSDAREVSIEYTFSGKVLYAGIGFNLMNDFPFLDLAGYDTLNINLTTEKAHNFIVAFRTFEPGITDTKRNFEPLRHMQVLVDTHKFPAPYRIPLSSLADPEWWLNQYATQKQGIEKQPLKYTLALQIFTSDSELIGQRERLTVTQLSLHKDRFFIQLLIYSLAACYYVLLGYLFVRNLFRRKITRNKQMIISSYKRLELNSYKDQDTEKITLFITEHYAEADITVEKLMQETGLSQKRIAEILHKEYKMNFKELINWLRLEEAKRLLINTDVNIIEIAFRLGYNSNSYFGSIFKKSEGLSPKEYRERHAAVH